MSVTPIGAARSARDTWLAERDLDPRLQRVDDIMRRARRLIDKVGLDYPEDVIRQLRLELVALADALGDEMP